MSQHYLDLYTHLPASPLSWLQQQRLKAQAQLTAHGLASNTEAWKYTRIEPLLRKNFTLPPQNFIIDNDILAALDLDWPDVYRLVFVNGHYQPHLSKLALLPDTVIVGTLAEALQNHPHLVEAHLGQYAAIHGEGLSALNTAVMEDGFFVYMPTGTVLEQPLHVLFLSRDGHLTQPRNLIIAEQRTHAGIIEHFASLDDSAGFTNSVTEIAAHQDSAIHHYKLQEENPRHLHVASLAVAQSGGQFHSHALLLGGQLTRNAIHVALNQPQTECNLYGVYLLHGRQHADTHTWIEHRLPDCHSRQYYKGILDGHARGIFSGRVLVTAEAQRTEAQQSNHNLLLSEDAEADCRPQLEIYADDVKCGHGATIGQLDDTALFYLRSRGIDAVTARNLLIYAFAEEVLDFIRVPAIHEHMRRRLIARLPAASMIQQLLAP
jgi:Fe-S cluster assembly protein SufD